MVNERRDGLHRAMVPGLPDPAVGLTTDYLTVRAGAPRTHLVLRGTGSAAEFVAAASAVAGALPLQPNTFRVVLEHQGSLQSFDLGEIPSGGRSEHGYLVWLSPEEWLLMLALGGDGSTSTSTGVIAGLSRKQVPFVDLSAGQGVIEVAGSGSADFLATGCPLDFDAAVFAAGACAQSLFGKCPVTILCLESETRFEIVVRTSMFSYLWQRMVRAVSPAP